MKQMGLALFLAMGIMMLFILPGFKVAYDAVFNATIAPMVELEEISAFDFALWKSMPLILLGLIIFGMLWAIFRRGQGGGGEGGTPQ